MILGHVIIGMVLGFVASIATMVTGWGIGTAFLAYCVAGAVTTLLLATMTFVFAGRGAEDVAAHRRSAT